MIDEIRVTNIEHWELEMVSQLKGIIAGETNLAVWSNGSEIGVEIPDDWPNLKRENLKRGVAKSLDGFQHDHIPKEKRKARVESIEHVETESVEFD